MKKYVIVLLMILALVLVINGSERKAVSQAQKEPIKIGILAEMTGLIAAYGYSNTKAIKTAVAKVNKEGGIMGRSVEVYVEDSESKPTMGPLKFRKLVETNGVDFVLGTNLSGVSIACAPLAKELRTPFFANSGAADISEDKGNRYVFQTCTNVKMECRSAARYGVEKIGKKWVIVASSFSWGWANERDFRQYVIENGGSVLNSITAPLGTSDWIPYLKGKIPKDADGIFLAVVGSDFLSLIRDLHAVNPEIKKLGGLYVLSGQDPKKLGAAAEGLYCITSYPTTLEGLNTKVNREYRQLIGVDADGKEIGTGNYLVLAYSWAPWEAFFGIKNAIEKSGWKRKEDNPKLIETLEGMAFKESLEFPQGDMYIRAEDHLTITGLYLEQIRKGELKVVARFPAEDAAYSPVVNRTKEPF